MKRFLLVIICSVFAYSATAQINPFEYEEEKPPLMKNEFTFGLNIHTAGWGLNARRSRNLTVNKKRLMEFEIVNMKHPKEVRSVNPQYDNAKSFFFGKINTMTVIRSAVGMQNVIASKAEKNGVEVRLHYSAGFSLGLAKPVYLNILVGTATNNPDQQIVVVQKYDPDIHRIENIYGRASFIEGIDEIKPYPGAYGKLGLTFEYGSYSTDIKCLEVGVTIDAYGKEVPIMANTDNDQFFLNLYINLLFGRKW